MSARIRYLLALAFLVAIVLSSQGRASYFNELYSEETYLSHQRIFSSSLRFRAGPNLTDFFSPYLLLGNEVSSNSSRPFRLDNASYAYLGPGLRLRHDNLSLSTEGRFRRFYDNSPIVQAPFDLRLIAVYNDFWSSPLSHQQGLFQFAELYSEAVFSSADQNNVISASFLRAGLRKALASVQCDLFLEPFITVDRLGHFYNNRADLKLSGRLIYRLSSLDFSLTASYVANRYFSFGDYEPNPYLHNNSGMRILFVVGGEL